MTHNPQTDDEIIAEDRRRYRRRMIEGLIPMLVLLGLLLLLVAGKHFHLLAPLGISRSIVIAAERFFPLAISIVVLPALLRNWPLKEARSERILRLQIDTYAVRWRWVSVMLLITLPLMTHNAIVQARHLHRSLSWASLFQPLWFPVGMLAFACVVVFGHGVAKSYREALSDELARALRARTVRFGYLALMAMLSAAYLAILYRLVPATTVLPALLAAGVAAPMIYYLVLDWRAGRGDG